MPTIAERRTAWCRSVKSLTTPLCGVGSHESSDGTGGERPSHKCDDTEDREREHYRYANGGGRENRKARKTPGGYGADDGRDENG